MHTNIYAELQKHMGKGQTITVDKTTGLGSADVACPDKMPTMYLEYVDQNLFAQNITLPAAKYLDMAQVNKKDHCAFLIGLSDDNQMWLGSTFLSEHTIRINHQDKTPVLGFAVKSDKPTPVPPPTHHKGMRGGTIAGIVLTCLGVVGGAGGVFYLKKQENKTQGYNQI